jgi:phosphate transport system substrate-binding protein
MNFGSRAAAALCLAAVAPALAGALPAAAQGAPREHLSIVGPMAVFPLAVAAGERFALDSGHAMPVVEPTGSEAGIALFCAGEGARHPDILGAVRRLTRADLAACTSNGVGVSELLVGYQAVALAQNPGPAPLFLTRRQLFLALAREVPVNGRLTANPYRLWSDIDFALPVKPIAVLGPPPGTPLRDAFVELVMAPAAAELPTLRGREVGALREDGVFVELGEDEGVVLSELARRPEALAIVSFNHLALKGEGFLAVPLDGVAPTPATIADGRYGAARPVQLYVKRAHAAFVPGLKDYLATLLGDAASSPAGFLTARGLVPLPPAAAAAQRAAAQSLPPL